MGNTFSNRIIPNTYHERNVYTMKRSEINNAILKAQARLDEYSIKLPAFGYWTPEQWADNGDKISRIRERMLGWDVTDFGTGDFAKCGAVLFTLRNGDKNDKENKAPYAEKYIILDDTEEQQIPLHYHMDKTEDIINRGGGTMVVEMYRKAADGGLDTEKCVDVYMDCIKYTFAPGSKIEVAPGNSITIEPYMYHRFYAKNGDGMLVAGEVSKVNDDNCDNVFYVKSERFCAIDEDESPVYPLVNEY